MIQARADGKIGRELRALSSAEEDLARELRAVAGRQSAEHEVYFGALSLAGQCIARAGRVAALADRYGTQIPVKVEEPGVWESLLIKAQREVSEAVGRQRVSGLVLLRDLRKLHLQAMEVDFHWTLAGQIAQAVRDPELLAGCLEMHEQATTAAKWILTQVKVHSPAILTVPD